MLCKETEVHKTQKIKPHSIYINIYYSRHVFMCLCIYEIYVHNNDATVQVDVFSSYSYKSEHYRL